MKNLLFFAAIFLFSINLFAQTEKRIALVMGNANYGGGQTLKNPVNDAELMKTTLEELGFEVMLLKDATLKQMQDVITDFAKKIPNYNVALFYYAGHGVQIDGVNYLIPIDAKLETKLQIKYQTIDISDINTAFAQNSEHLNIMILDACRDNPLCSWMRSIGNRGFKSMSNQPIGTIIAFATKEGETASDGTRNNGLFTEKLVQQMKTRQNITEVFENTRIEVLKASNKKQCPQEWNMLTGKFYFKNVEEKQKKTSKKVIEVEEEIIETYGIIELTPEITGKLLLDGQVIKTITVLNSKQTLRNIPTGNHTLSIEGSENWTQQISVAKDETVKITAKSTKKQVATVVKKEENKNTEVLENEFTESVTGMRFVLVKGGTFQMGSNDADAGDNEKPVHQVTVSDYYIAVTEVTQKQWVAIMGTNPSNFKGDNLPVENVSWNACQEFVQILNEKTGKKFRLPTEAEWEYAARGGNRSVGYMYMYSGSDNIDEVAWYDNNSGSKTHPVGTKKANQLGVYDLSGNVWEWCQDWYGSYSSSTQTNPTGPTTGQNRLLRGGSWFSNARLCRSANRNYNTPTLRNYYVGFRLILSLQVR